jgi:hypothetical protein
MADSLATIAALPFDKAVEKLEDLMSQSNRAFLIGAGCSYCAGLPLTSQLTELVLKTPVTPETKAVLAALAKQFEGASNTTIEDFMSELVDLLAIAERRKDRSAKNATVELGGKTYTVDGLHTALLEIKEGIANSIEAKKPDILTHWQFVRAVHRTLRSGKTGPHKPVEYLVLNYDTLIEDALALERLAYVDGFHGGSTAWWDANVFSADACDARILKIHGSIDWCELNDEPLPCRIRPSLTLPAGTKRRVLIWPAATKYRETQKDPYAQILGVVRKALRPSPNSEVVLTVCGYRFADSHINVEIDRALRESNKALTIVVFTELEKPEGILKQWTEDATVKDQVLIYARRGFFHGADVAPSDKDLPWWKFENLTRLLGGER